MESIKQTSYAETRAKATNIKNSAEVINDTFNNIDNQMKRLYGENWESSGADASNGEFQKLKREFEPLYNAVINMHEHIMRVTSSNETADAYANKSISESTERL
jgi:WXG100 family type VII secretion target